MKFTKTFEDGSTITVEGDAKPTETDWQEIKASQAPEPEPPEESGIGKAFFPTAGDIPGEGVKPTLKRAGVGALEVLDFPKRLLGKLRGFDVSDPESALLQPEALKIEEKGRSEIQPEIDFLEGEIKKPEITETLKETFRSRVTELKGLQKEGTTPIPSKIAAEVVREAPTLGVGFIAKLGKGILKEVGKQARKAAKNISGVSDDLFEAIGFAGKGQKKLAANQGKMAEVGEELTDFFKNPQFKENKIIEAKIKKVRDIDLSSTVKSLEEAKSKGKLGSAANEEIDNIIKELTDDGATTSLTAEEFLATRRELDNRIGDLFNKIDPGGKTPNKALKQKLKKVANTMRQEIRTAAIESKQPELVSNLSSLNKKLDAMQALKFKGGTNASSFLRNLFGKDKTKQLNSLKLLEKLSDGKLKISDRAKFIKVADELEPGDLEGFLIPPKGKSLLGQIPLASSPTVLKTAASTEKGIEDLTSLLIDAGVDQANVGAILNAISRVGEGQP